jgi:hypothetical protein
MVINFLFYCWTILYFLLPPFKNSNQLCQEPIILVKKLSLDIILLNNPIKFKKKQENLEK